MADLNLTGRDIDAIARTAQSEVGGWTGANLYSGVRGVVDTIVNRAATGPEIGGVEGDIQGTVNARNQFSGINSNLPSAAGSWNKAPAASAAVREAVADRLNELAMGAPTRQFTHFDNPETTAKYVAQGISSAATGRRSQALLTDPNSMVVGTVGNRHSYGLAPGAPLERGFSVTLDPSALATVSNWRNPDQDSMSEVAAQNRNMEAQRAQFTGLNDFGPPVWDGKWNMANELAAPVSPVERQSLPDIQSYPSISQDQPDAAMPADVGWGKTFDTTPSFGTIAQDQPGAPRTADVSPYGFSGMQPSRAFTAVQNDLSQQYASTPPSSTQFSPSFDMSVNTGWAPDKDTTPAPSKASVSPTSFATGFTTTPMADFGSLSLDLAPSYTPTYDGSVPASPTASAYGAPPTTNSVTPSVDNLGISLPPDVPAPTFDLQTPSMPAPTVTPQRAQQVAQPARPQALSAPKAIAAPRPVQSFNEDAPTVDTTSPSYNPKDFSTAFNGSFYGPDAAKNRAAFSGYTGMNPTTVDSLMSQYAAAGPLTVVAYNALQDAFQHPQPQTQTQPQTVPAPSPVTSAPLPDLNPQIGAWGQANNVTGNWNTDTSMKAVNDRIAGYGSMTIDPVTGKMMSTADDASTGWGLGGLFSGLGGLFSGGWGGGGMNTGENDPHGPTGGLW